ncbi:hypothetical protein [Micromonospora sp. NPDC126480]|uniref:hypothetical protein n=1 Tax=Micromonospora sp. NPDC126480 TaxID=3155312 RepID=UPI0033319D26
MGVYRSSVSWHREEAEAEAAREILASHVPDRDTGLCVICLRPGPCTPANAAANRLVDLGRPVLPAIEPRQRRTGLRGWFAPRRTDRSSPESPPRRLPPRRAPLLTYAWIVRLGAARAGGVTP